MNDINHKVILGIIKDALIADRTFSLMRRATNVLAPMEYKGSYKPDYHYNGVLNAFMLMGVTNEDMKDELFTVFSTASVEEEPVDDLPEKVYVEWLSILANHYMEENTGKIQMKKS